MLSALLGLALILVIAAVTVALGALSRLLAARIVGPGTRDGAPLTPLDRIALGNELIARDLQPDSTHPVARTAARDALPDARAEPTGQLEPAQRYFFAAPHGLQ